MRIGFTGVPRRKAPAFKQEIRDALSVDPEQKIKFARLPDTIGEATIIIELGANGPLSNAQFESVASIIDRVATPYRAAKCSVMNGGKTPVIALHRWSLPKPKKRNRARA